MAVIVGVIGAILGLAAVAAVVPRSRFNPASLSLGLSMVASAAILFLGGALLVTGTTVVASAGTVLAFDLVSVRYDALSAVFLIALGVVGIASSLFEIGHGRGHVADRIAAAYPLFIGSMLLVFGASDAFAFLLAWELMALSSAALIVGSRPSPEVARAGFVYLALTHLASAALVVAFAVLAASGGSTAFAAFASGARTMSPLTRDLVFVLLLVGFGTKAGAIPFHVWLPKAHPIAPSHVSALMSGVMIKTGIYGFVRLTIDILGPGPEWWGLLVIGIGVASAVLGVLYALMEQDLKRLLAFSSIENIGIILIGVGVALVATSHGLGALAGLALAGALFHAFNHAIFKGALFLGAGAIQAATGTRDLNALGGLARLMPLTSLGFGVAAAAISGLPPLNGFASEWLTFQGLLAAGGDDLLSPVARSVVLLAVGGLGLSVALTLACFVKATGMTFLALPRGAGGIRASETSRTMGVAIAILAAGCVAIGLAAGPVGRIVAGVADGITDPVTAAPAASSLAALAAGPGGGAYAAGPLGLVLVGAAVATWATARRGRRTRRTATWTGGIQPEAEFEYAAASYAKLIRLYFGPLLRPASEITVELHPGTPFPRTVRYRGRVSHVLDERLYDPSHRIAVAAAQLIRRLQSGSIQLYLAYAVAAVVALLLLAR